jgi:hypothetical protein
VIRLAVTVDHELPSRGGDPDCCGLGPAVRIAQVCRRFACPVTWFPDALGWGEHRGVWDQLREFQDAGHELGAHVHPEHREEGGSCDRTSRLDDWVSETVDWVSRFGPPPTAVRAGAWRLPLDERWGDTMRIHGLRVDSSVVPGRRLRGVYDFRSAPRMGVWRFQGHPVRAVSDGSLVEAPVATARIGALRDLVGLMRLRGGAPGCHAPRRRGAIPSRLAALGVAALDPCAHPWDNLLSVVQLGAPRPLYVCVVHTQRFSRRAERGLSDLLAFARVHDWQLTTLSEGALACARSS